MTTAARRVGGARGQRPTRGKRLAPTSRVLDPAELEQIRFRHIGPFRGGRVVAVAGDPQDRQTFYFGSAGGGIFKTTDGGLYWRNVSDGYLNVGSIGAIAVCDGDPNVVYAGTGEACIRNSVSPGDGVYRSTDSGRSWTHLGLERTRHIARVRIHPEQPDLVYVAATGDVFGDDPQRGVFRSRDGGRSWDQVLGGAPHVGAADLWLDPTNPRVLYAAMWQVQRLPWTVSSGGPGSGLFRSDDGGDSWVDLSAHPGFPRTMKGRIGVTSSPARPSRVWAVVEAAGEKSGLYRSEDHGDTWDRISTEPDLLGRPFYYSHIVADPQDAERLYSMNFAFTRSTDGGRTFSHVPTPHGDNHDLWIDPRDSNRMIEGNDGGACVSFNGGATFSSIYNQPTSQHYRVATDRRSPYRVYATQQDNSAICVPSRSRSGVITWADCYECGHSESGDIVVDPRNDDVVYSGAVGSSPGGGGPLMRYDHRTATVSLVNVWPEYYFGSAPADLRHRFNWTFPIETSPHDPALLYACAERVFRSADGGRSWEPASPDLTRADPERMQRSGGDITPDTSGAETYCTIHAFAESPHRAGVLWAGTDDGLVHLSRNAGRTWRPVTPPDLPEWATVQKIEPSPHRASTVYLAATRYRLGDRGPLLWRTDDLGGSWTTIAGNLPDDLIVRVLRADPVRPGLLYLGTETGLYLSFDDGTTWEPLPGNLPRTPVYDLTFAGHDLVVATHGRGLWVLDDLAPVRALDGDRSQPRLFPVSAAQRFWSLAAMYGVTEVREPGYFGTAFIDVRRRRDGTVEELLLDAGANPPGGAAISYWLPHEVPAAGLELTIVDSAGRTVASFTPQTDEEAESPTVGATEVEATEGEEQEGEPLKKWRWENLPRRAGFNRFWWNLRHSGVRALPDPKGRRLLGTGPVVVPGTYEARLTVNGTTHTTPVEVLPDPEIQVSRRDLAAQCGLLLELRDAQNEVHDAIVRARAVHRQLREQLERGPAPELRRRIKATEKRLVAATETLTRDKESGGSSALLSKPAGFDTKLADLAMASSMGDARPPEQFLAAGKELVTAASQAVADLETLLTEVVAPLAEELLALGWLPLAAPEVEPVPGAARPAARQRPAATAATGATGARGATRKPSRSPGRRR